MRVDRPERQICALISIAEYFYVKAGMQLLKIPQPGRSIHDAPKGRLGRVSGTHAMMLAQGRTVSLARSRRIRGHTAKV